jgi:hypothetical protein
MKRVDNWPEKLTEYVESRRAEPFEWGRNDCMLFAADGISVLTGVDLVPELRGSYSTQIGAARRIVEVYGTASLAGAAECFAEKWGIEEISIKFAGRGDVVLCANSGNPCLAICIGLHAVSAGPNGMLRLPMSDTLRAWRTPY